MLTPLTLLLPVTSTRQQQHGKKQRCGLILINCLNQHLSVACCRRGICTDCGRSGIFSLFSKLLDEVWCFRVTGPRGYAASLSRCSRDNKFWAFFLSEHSSLPFPLPLGPGNAETSRNVQINQGHTVAWCRLQEAVWLLLKSNKSEQEGCRLYPWVAITPLFLLWDVSRDISCY